jgi:adenylate kinase
MRSSISEPEPETMVVGRPRAKYRAILLFGAPGSGKGTQGRLLGATPGFFHCACGDVFRALDIRSPLGRAFMDHSTRGELVPDELTVGLWQRRLDDHVAASTFRPDDHWLVLDGIPRNRNQARMMEAFIDVSLVLHLCCDDPAVLGQRLGRRASEDHRPDDTVVEVVRRRLAVFESESLGVLDCYPRPNVRTVDASASPGDVLAEILGHILGVGDITSRTPAR